jgi:hypothetical protein
MVNRILNNQVEDWLGQDPVDPLAEWEPGILQERNGRLVAGG